MKTERLTPNDKIHLLVAACEAARGAIVFGNGRNIDWKAIADQLGCAIDAARPTPAKRGEPPTNKQ